MCKVLVRFQYGRGMEVIIVISMASMLSEVVGKVDMIIFVGKCAFIHPSNWRCQDTPLVSLFCISNLISRSRDYHKLLSCCVYYFFSSSMYIKINFPYASSALELELQGVVGALQSSQLRQKLISIRQLCWKNNSKRFDHMQTSYFVGGMLKALLN